MISLSYVLQAGIWMAKLERSKNFSATAVHLNIPTQFLSTLFELESANLCISNSLIYDLEFEPAIKTRSPGKVPDFSITEAGYGSIVCECKDMHSVNRAADSLGGVFRSVLMKELETRMISPRFRVEVSLRSMPNVERAQLARMILDFVGSNDATCEERFVPGTEERISARLANKEDPPRPLGGIVISSFGTSEPPTSVRHQDSPLLIYDQRSIPTDTGKVLNEANDQLPVGQWGVVFLRPLSLPDVIKAVGRRAHDPAYKRLLAVVVKSDDDWHVVAAHGSSQPFGELLQAGKKRLLQP